MFIVEDGYVAKPKNITEEMYNAFLKDYVRYGKYAFQYTGLDQHSEFDFSLGVFARKYKTDAYNLLKFFKNYVDMSVYEMVENLEEARRNELTERYGDFFDNTKQINFLRKLKKQAIKNELRNKKEPNNPYNFKMKFSYVPANMDRIEVRDSGYGEYFLALGQEESLNKLFVDCFKPEYLTPLGMEAVYSNVGSNRLKYAIQSDGYSWFKENENYLNFDYDSAKEWSYLKEGVSPYDLKLGIIEQEIKNMKFKYHPKAFYDVVQKVIYGGLSFYNSAISELKHKKDKTPQDDVVYERLDKKLKDIYALINEYNEDNEQMEKSRTEYFSMYENSDSPTH